MTTLRPDRIATSAERLRDATVALLDRLDDHQLAAPALPARPGCRTAWTVGDVFRHLAAADRRTVLGVHLVDFLPSRTDDDLQTGNDLALERLRAAPRQQLRDELVGWGRRLRRLIGLTPAPLARVTVPTLFGRVTLGWFATLRVYDEWVHQVDVHRALDLGEVPMDAGTRDLLAEFQLRALPARPLRAIGGRDGVVEVRLTDASGQPPWRFDLAERRFGAHVDAPATVQIVSDVATWTLVAADRIAWRDAVAAGDLRVSGENREAASALLDVVRVV